MARVLYLLYLIEDKAPIAKYCTYRFIVCRVRCRFSNKHMHVIC